MSVTTDVLRHRPAAAGPGPAQTPRGSARLFHHQELLGRFVTLDLRDAGLDRAALARAARAAVSALYDAERLLGPARVRARRSRPAAVPADAEVVLHCEQARQATQGWFDPWSLAGGFDPAGLARGWAAQQALDALGRSGVRHAMVEVDGDAVVMGSAAGRPDGAGWSLALVDPTRPSALLADVKLHDQAIATAAALRRPRGSRARRAAAGLSSATVIAPDLAAADAYASAALAHGPGALQWLARLAGVQALLVTADGQLTTPGWAEQGRPPSIPAGS